MRKKILLAATLCAATFSPIYTVYAAGGTDVVLEVQQNGRTVKGTVVDKAGEPVIGANVIVKGTTNGVITNLDGHFTIVNAKGTLVISFIGYRTQEIAIREQTNIRVILQEDSELLDEVVVVGYGAQKKASLTSAISQVRGEDVFENKGITNPTTALQGEVPGLTVLRGSSRPGSEGASMKIRGDISINGDGNPLVIIDGISGSLDELNAMNPNDIENVSVLKDASAAIYGARSAAGVVLVTTKRGKQGKAQISYSGAVSRTITGIQTPYTNNFEWLDMFFEAQYWDVAADHPEYSDPRQLYQNINWWIFNNNDNGGVAVDGHRPIVYRGSNLFDALRNGDILTVNNGDFLERWDPYHYMEDYLYGQATSQKHAITISGADDKFGYYASFNYSDEQSHLKIAEDGQKKYGGRLNMDYKAYDYLKFEMGMSYEKQDVTTPSTGVGLGWQDQWFWPIYSEDGKILDVFDGRRNPIGQITQGGQNRNDFTTFRGNAKAILDLNKWVKGLQVSANGNYKLARREYQEVKRPISFYDWSGNRVMGTLQAPGSLKEEMKKWENITLGTQVNYENTFAGVHYVSAMLGMTAEQEHYKAVSASRNKGAMYPDSDLSDLEVWTGGDNNGAGGGQSSWGFVSYLGRLNYAYDNKYSVELLGRRDGSSKLSTSQRWKNFYSASGYWRISSENFMKDFTWLSDLKVRYNYGKTGSITGIGDYERFAVIKTGTTYFGKGDATAHPSMWVDGIRSDNRTWETLISHNIGVDIAFLDNRLKGSFDYFSRTNDNMFIGITYPAVLGAGAPNTNSGKLRTKGWELSASWDDQAGDFKYGISASLSDASTKVLRLENNTNIPVAGYNGSKNRLIDRPINSIYVYQTDGLFQTQEEVDAFYEMYYWNADHTGPKADNILPKPDVKGTGRLRPGARRFVDRDGDGAITRHDLYYAGDAAPRLNFGIRAKLAWKGIDFSAFFQGVGKQVLLRTGSVYAPFVVNYVRQNKNYLGKTWAPNNTDAEYPILSRNNGFNQFNYNNVDASLQKSRYIRLKSLVVGYTLPKQWTAKAGINKLRFYFSGDDLWEWTSINDGYDPERGEASNNGFPFSRLLTFGVDVTF